MPIVASDLVAYAAANMPEDESSTVGGAIDTDNRVVFTDIAATDDVEAVSSNGADTMNLTVYGRSAGGATVNQTKALNGTTPITFDTLGAVERIQKATLASDAAGTVTVRRATGDTTIGTIVAGERGFMRMFINAFSDVGAKDYYMKFFWKNNHATLALLNAVVQENADPTGKITFTLAAAADDTATSTNRLTAPSAGNIEPDTFGNSDVNVPGTDLAAGSRIGVWLKLALGAAEAPIKSTYTSQIAGQSV